ncbi:glycerophosphodiester phosphodiesterase [Salinicoccus carnicancri]|uniref:glycerophosphodiester phosphodiesterase n=1 Tax=Salinicoccus carnicancri TaxID=558170 RepID=UPI0002F7DAE0|nr:glycerophosphodiester phosphodiesterase [Salinicoccus carnicancri]
MTKIYAHRGAMGTHPENTMLAFKEALDAGVDGLEVDVHMTSDGHLVVIHDEYVEEKTDGRGMIRDMTLAEIRTLSAGVRYQDFEAYEGAWDKETVPTLEEVMDLADHHDIELNIELKTDKVLYEGIEEKVDAMVSAYSIEHKVIYSSFHLPTLIRMKTINPNARVAWLSKKVPGIIYDYINTLRLDALHLSYKAVLKKVERINRTEDKVRVWTVNDTGSAKQFFELGVEAIMTDFPRQMIRVREEYEAAETGTEE